MKHCNKCGMEKPLEQFSRKSDNADGHRSYCKACGAEMSRAWYVANRERRAEAGRVWAEANREKVAEYAARKRVKYPEHMAARRAVSHAVEGGKMPPARELPCTMCGAPAEEYHHPDYSQPLDVVAVCLPCHVELHKEMD